VSNRYLDLAGPLARGAHDLGLAALEAVDTARTPGRTPSHYVAMARRYGDFGGLLAKDRWRPPTRGRRSWTDDYSNVFSVWKRTGA
jgi:hypothetical protein